MTDTLNAQGSRMTLSIGDTTDFDVSHVRVNKLDPSDVIVLRTADRLSLSNIDRIRELVEPLFPSNKVLVLEAGADIELYQGEGGVKSL